MERSARDTLLARVHFNTNSCWSMRVSSCAQSGDLAPLGVLALEGWGTYWGELLVLSDSVGVGRLLPSFPSGKCSQPAQVGILDRLRGLVESVRLFYS